MKAERKDKLIGIGILAALVVLILVLLAGIGAAFGWGFSLTCCGP